MPSNKTLKIKKVLARRGRLNRSIPDWVRRRSDNKIRFNKKMRNWRRVKLGI